MITLDNTSSTRNSSGGTTTVSHATGTGQDRLMVVLTSCQDGNHANFPISKILYAGRALTKVRHDEPVGNVRTEIWILVNPPIGTSDCVVSFAGALGEATVGVVTLFGARIVNQPDANNGATGTSNNPTLSLTTVQDKCWILSVCAAETTFSGSGGQTVLSGYPKTDQSFENTDAGRIQDITPAGATTVDFTIGSSQVWALSAVSILPAIVEEQKKFHLVQGFQ